MTDEHSTAELRLPGRALSAYLLGTLKFETLLAMQRRLVYEVGGDPAAAAIIVCDHPPGITIGREGSRVDVRPNPEALSALGWQPRWVSRGGGAMLHLPGQVACYPILPLQLLGITAGRYVEELQQVASGLLGEYDLIGTPDPARPGVRVNGRRVAHVGVAVRDRITCFGMIVNADPDLAPFREVRCDGDRVPMTSIQRESAGRVRIPAVRQQLVERIAAQFGFDRVSVFHTLPGTLPRPIPHAAAYRT